MSEATYTAWDDNLYEWPPPDGWYQADDGKWWPEGYGPTDEASPGEERSDEGQNEALLFEVERTSIFPAGGSGLVGTNQSEDRIEAESQRPVYDELPSIDDVFGGTDPYADEESEPSNSNGGVAFSGPPPSIDDLPGLSDLELADDHEVDDHDANGNGDEGNGDGQGSTTSPTLIDQAETDFDGFTVGDEGLVAERESVDVDSHVHDDADIGDDVDGDLADADLPDDGHARGAYVEGDRVDDDRVDDLESGELADGELVDVGHPVDGDLGDDEFVEADVPDGEHLTEADLAEDDVADEDLAEADLVDEDLVDEDLVDEDLADADIHVDDTADDDTAGDETAEDADTDTDTDTDDADTDDADTDDTDTDGVDHDEEAVDADARAEARAGFGADDSDEAFEQIVENYDSTESADGELEEPDEVEVDEEFDAETMVSGVHLGELPDKLPDPNATAPIAPMAEVPQESPLPDVGVHMDTMPADAEALDALDMDASDVDAGPSIAATTADVDPHHDELPDEEVVYGDSPAIGQLQHQDGEVAQYRDDPDLAHEPGRRWWPIVAVAATALVVGGLVLFLLFGRNDDAGFDVSASLADTRAGSLGEPYSSGTGVVVFYNDADTGEERRWVIQVVETVADQSDQLVAEQGAGAPADGNVLAVSRIRVTYQSGPAPGQASDLLFTTIGSSLAFFDQGNECTAAEALDLATGLDPGQAIEGNVCWEVPSGDLADLKLAVEAGPVDGVVFMNLN